MNMEHPDEVGLHNPQDIATEVENSILNLDMGSQIPAEESGGEAVAASASVADTIPSHNRIIYRRRERRFVTDASTEAAIAELTPVVEPKKWRKGRRFWLKSGMAAGLALMGVAALTIGSDADSSDEALSTTSMPGLSDTTFVDTLPSTSTIDSASTLSPVILATSPAETTTSVTAATISPETTVPSETTIETTVPAIEATTTSEAISLDIDTVPLPEETAETTTTLSMQEIQAHIYDHVNCEDAVAEIVANGFFSSLAQHCGLKTTTLLRYNPQFSMYDIEHLLPGTDVYLHPGLAVGSSSQSSSSHEAVTLENCYANGGKPQVISEGFTLRKYLTDLGISATDIDKYIGVIAGRFGLSNAVVGAEYCLPDAEGLEVLWGI